MIVLELLVAFIVFILVLVILIPIIHYRHVRKMSKYLHSIPGPIPSPYTGNFPLRLFINSESIIPMLSDFIRDHGNVLNLYRGPLATTLLVAEEKLLEAIMSSPKTITKSLEYGYLESWLGTGLLTSTGYKWKKRRRLLTPAFHFSILENFIEVFESVGEVFVKKLERYSGSSSFDIYPMVSLLTLDIICETAMGISVNAQTYENSEYPTTIKKICELMTRKNFSLITAIHPNLYYLTPSYYKEKSLLKKLHSHTDAVIDRKLTELREKGPKKVENNDDFGLKKRKAFLDLLLESTIDEKLLSRSDIREEVDTFMFEGHDTTSSAIAFTLYELANHPDVQAKALEEQKQIFGDLKTAKATHKELSEMKYLELVIKEALRLYPPVPMFGRRLTEDFNYGDLTLPKGLHVVLSSYAVQRDPKYYKEPLKFIPERFEEIDGTRPYVYIPFSAGPRNCIGQKFAMLELKSTVSKVLRNYQLLPDKQHELRLAPELILVSKSGVKLSVKKR